MNFPGAGIIKGLVVTARNALGSYVDRKRAKRLIVECYPEERPRLAEASRSFPFLIYDGDDPEGGIRCVACKICEVECPPKCIYIELERDAAGKSLKRPKVFNIDIGVCMGCQICAEVCQFESVRMDNIFEMSSYDRFESLLLDKTRLLKSNAYYRYIKPTECAETDAIRVDRLKKQKPKTEATA